MTSNASGPQVDEKRAVDGGTAPSVEPTDPNTTAGRSTADQDAPPPASPESNGEGQPLEDAATESMPGAPAVQRSRIQIGSRRGMVPKALKTTLPRTVVPPLPTPRPTEPPAEDQPGPAAQVVTPEPPAAEDATPVEPVVDLADAAAEEPSQTVLDELHAARTKSPVPPPSRREKLPADVERQLEAALADVSLERIVNDPAASVAARASEILEPDTRLHGTIVRIHGDNAFFALGGRNEGVASVRQFRETPTVGRELEVVIRKFLAEEGLYELAIPGQSIAVGDWSDLTEGAVVEARITGANTGGLECMVNNIRGFIPSSQIGLFRVEDFAEYIGQKLLCVATEVNRRRKNLVLSHRALAEREREEARKKLIDEIEPGQTREGVVRSIQDFGAFVDLGGVDGLIHISQLSWDRVNHPSEVLQEGQKVRVKVEKVNRQTGKIGLSYRDLLDRPWSHAEEQFAVSAVVKGVVSRIAKFGAFVKLAPGVEGLIHISELAHHRVRTVNDVLNEGQEVEVKILSIDAAAQRIALSIKAALPEPQEEPPEPDEASQPAQQQPRRAKRSLKGGFDRPTGGEQFGLRW
jgi:small subunit ribosomal protein S1